MKKTIKILFIAFLLCLYFFICKINSIPTEMILFQGEKIDIGNFLGLSLDIEDDEYNSVLASTSLDDSMQAEIGNIEANVKLFNTFTVKTVNVSVIKRAEVIPVGQVAGLKLYTHGVLVVGMSEIKTEDNQKCKPYENSGIQEGDMIVEVNDVEVIDTDSLIEKVNNSNGEAINIKYIRNGENSECVITPAKVSKEEYKLGLWVRDSAAGIGTLTYYDPETKTFAALGHGITDVDTGNLIDISNGEFLSTKIISIVKGIKGNPGKIQGSIENQTNIGTIYKNSELGIYGKLENLAAIKIDASKKMEVAQRNEIELGKATILCTLDGGDPKEYEIEIERIYINNNENNKSMLIKVTDNELIDKTGGIIQGMSGSPIIQNGKFIGAVTNVLVNDPTSGYGVFGDLMLKEAQR